MVLPSLSVWTQHLGRAGRSGEPATVILLVEPSVYQLKKLKNIARSGDEGDEDHEDEDEGGEDGGSDMGPVVNADPIYRKKVEEGMWKWIETTEC
jgi:hypothetical protein